jgi:hypothetical protein
LREYELIANAQCILALVTLSICSPRLRKENENIRIIKEKEEEREEETQEREKT